MSARADDRLGLLAEPWRGRVAGAVSWLAGRGFGGRVGLILGSGLGNFVDAVQGARAVDYGEIPGYHTTSVAEHVGRLVAARRRGRARAGDAGPAAPLRGAAPPSCCCPRRCWPAWASTVAVVTNAAGGLNRFYRRAT